MRNLYTQLGGDYDPATGTLFTRPREFTDDEYEAVALNAVGRRILYRRGHDATREGVDLVAPSAFSKFARYAEGRMKQLGLLSATEQAIGRANTFSRSIIVKGYATDDYSRSDGLASPPPRGARVTWLRVYDRRQFHPEEWQGPSAGTDFGQPLLYNVTGFWRPRYDGDFERYGALSSRRGGAFGSMKVHASRCIPFVGPEGRSAVIGLADALARFFSGSSAIEEALGNFSLATYYIQGWRGMVDQNERRARMKAAIEHRRKGNKTPLFLDKMEEEFKWNGSPTSGASDLYYSILLGLCAAAEMSMTNLFGMPAPGFSNGEMEEKLWAGVVRSVFSAQVQPAIENMIDDFAAEVGVQIPIDAIEIVQRPLDPPTPTEEAELESKHVETAKTGIEIGLGTVDEYRMAIYGRDGFGRMRVSAPLPVRASNASIPVGIFTTVADVLARVGIDIAPEAAEQLIQAADPTLAERAASMVAAQVAALKGGAITPARPEGAPPVASPAVSAPALATTNGPVAAPDAPAPVVPPPPPPPPPALPPGETWATAQELAEGLGCTRSWVRRLGRARLVPFWPRSGPKGAGQYGREAVYRAQVAQVVPPADPTPNDPDDEEDEPDDT